MKFTVITVVKNGMPNIKLTLKSLKNQTYRNYEHIIFNGKSTDGTSEFILKKLNNKIIYINKKDKGIYDALNKSLKKAKGQYIIILHSGDFFYSKNSLHFLYKFIKKYKKYDFYFSDILFYNEKNEKISRIWNISPKNINKVNFLKIAHTSLCITKKVSTKIFYNKELKISADTDYLFDLCHNFKGKYFNNFFIYMDDKGLSNSKKFFFIKLKEDIQILYKRFGLFFLFIFIYKIMIKIPGIFLKKDKFNENFLIEKKKLI